MHQEYAFREDSQEEGAFNVFPGREFVSLGEQRLGVESRLTFDQCNVRLLATHTHCLGHSS